MKKIIFLSVCMFFAIASMAQSNNDEIAIFQSIYGMGKQQLVSDHMKFTEAESARFWKIYDEYEVSRKEIGKKRAANILEYADNYQNLSSEKVTQLVNESLELNASFYKLLDKTFRKVSKEISPVRAAQFYQMEFFLEGIVRVKMADEIPLIQGIHEKK
jgi:CRISPR/Cas system CSM-associated protein Csm2 small subunit